MYDARNSSNFEGQSGLIFGIITIAVVVTAFFGVLLMPGGDKESAGLLTAQNEAENVILTKLDDRHTKRYVMALSRISPEAAEQLNQDAAEALADGASKNDLARLVQATFNEDISGVMGDLAKVDVRHINEMIGFTKDSLQGLSSSRSKWCKVSTYERMQSQPPEELFDLVLNGMDYTSPLYRFGVQGNAIVFEAVADARDNPVRHGRMTREDKKALEGLALKMMMNPEIQKLARVQSMSPLQKQQVISNTDACKLAIAAIDVVDSLPDGTKGRMWAEGFRQFDRGELSRAMSQFGGF